MIKRGSKAVNTKLILDWNSYIEKARETVSEGCVLLKNDNSVLPLRIGARVSLFGRIQNHYYKSGVGSGGMVNVDKVTGILEGLENSGKIVVNGSLLDIYNTWECDNPYDEGCGWGKEPWSQPEMPLTDEIVMQAAEVSEVALVIIGRTAGEDRDAADTPGSYRLTELEEDMLARVRKYFDRMVVLLNVGGIIDMTFVDKFAPDAVMYVWQGGMVGGDGIADVLTGAVSPSGKLTDTIAYRIEDYPSDESFGDREKNFYCEDIYVGYRYFETFARERVRYPFGYGMSYTTFDFAVAGTDYDAANMRASVSVSVKNTGNVPGKEVVQLYAEAPQGVLGKPLRALVAFEKTGLLMPGQEQLLFFEVDCRNMASYDDSGVTGHKSCFVLEDGAYQLYVGTDVRRAVSALTFSVDETTVTEQLEQALAPTEGFSRIKPVRAQIQGAETGQDKFIVSREPVPLAEVDVRDRMEARSPRPFDNRGVAAGVIGTVAVQSSASDMVLDAESKTYVLKDVMDGRVSMERFVAQMSDYDLACIVSGEGMGSPLVTPGTASAFGGVSVRLREYGIPAVCCSDGPSGIRMDCGTRAFSLPNGTLLGCTFNPALVEELYRFTGMELAANRIECLLGPGMNIHRHPLNGRNFEYFSEDPYVTGVMAAAQLRGLRVEGMTGVLKHFCGNNQELGRRTADTIISERALREIYLKAFEMVVKNEKADAVMTSYGVVNGIRTSESYDLCTTILRGEWGFSGIVMTDWWAKIGRENTVDSEDGFMLMVRSQNDVFMVNTEAADNEYVENTCRYLSEHPEARALLQRSAANICRFVTETRAMRRLLGTNEEIELINRREEDNQDNLWDMEYIRLDGDLTYDLSYKESKNGTNYVIPLDIEKGGTYEAVLTGRSSAGELAQIPCSLFAMGTPVGTFTFNGTEGEAVSLTRQFICYKRKCLLRLYVGGNGLTLERLELRFLTDNMNLALS